MESFDGGITWEDIAWTTTVPLWAMAVSPSTKEAWVVGTNGTIARRSRGVGSYSWSTVTSPVATTLWATAAAPGSRTGWAVGNDGVVLRTADAGTSWSLVATITGETLTGIHAASEKVAWLVSNRGSLFKTIDGGATWTRQYSQNATVFIGVHAGSENFLWLFDAIEGGVTNITASTDGGTTWTQQYVDRSITSDRRLGGLVATGPYDAWAISTGQILRTTTGGFSTLSSRLPLVARSSGL
jgi:photosystem II stability/assembly factor-like uncharacterized protein